MSHNLKGEIIAETSAAILFRSYNTESDYEARDGDSIWFPLSQVDEIHRTYSIASGTLDEIVVSDWIAKKKGLV